MIAGFKFEETDIAWVHSADCIVDGMTVGKTHDGVNLAMNGENWRGDLFPNFAKIERLQLLVEGSGAAVLAA